MSKLLRTVALAGVIACGISASCRANTINVGALPPDYASPTTHPAGTFSTNYTFSTSQSDEISVDYTWSKFTQTVVGETLKLFSGTPTGSHTLLDDGSSTSKSGSIVFTDDGPYAAGDFYAVVTGKGNASASYTLDISVTAVATPLPGSAFLFTGGVLLIGLLMWRRKQEISFDQASYLRAV